MGRPGAPALVRLRDVRGLHDAFRPDADPRRAPVRVLARAVPPLHIHGRAARPFGGRDLRSPPGGAAVARQPRRADPARHAGDTAGHGAHSVHRLQHAVRERRALCQRRCRHPLAPRRLRDAGRARPRRVHAPVVASVAARALPAGDGIRARLQRRALHPRRSARLALRRRRLRLRHAAVRRPRGRGGAGLTPCRGGRARVQAVGSASGARRRAGSAARRARRRRR